MKRRTLGALDVSAIGLGCMSMTDSYGKADPDEAEKTLHRAIEIGVTFFDTANAYGLEENAAAAEIELDAERIDHLDALFTPDRIVGDRYAHAWMKSSDTED
ncbi:MAG: aldo/keto reductase [Myxococcota bacterium]|jgi:predicted aldo/keto reductase-like oxidoreductase|nr:aldo/keto reductase [Myxococcota bacterium]